MKVEATLSRHPHDPSHREAMIRAQIHASSPAFAPQAPYAPVADPAPDSGEIGLSRRIKRLTETREIRVRTTHRRRRYFARGGVLASFGVAMVVYPILGNVMPYEGAVSAIPGVVLGQSPTTGHALLGDGPALIPTVMDIPTEAELATALANTSGQYIVSSALPTCQLPATFGGVNGELPSDQLCTLWGDIQLRADAAIAFAEMNEEFKVSFGRDLCVEQGYRSYSEQVAIKASKGHLAATPGKSLHGFGLALDFCRGDYSGEPGKWLANNAAAYGFWNPDWAKSRLYEPWHWEYKVGVEATGAYDGGGYWESDGVAVIGTDGQIITDATTAPTPAPTAAPSPNPAP